jgi:peptide chain release factor subunit 1
MVKPVKRSNYICDKKFHIDYAKELTNPNKNKYGIMMVFGKETLFYTYSSTNIKLVNKITLYRQKNNKAGGQSAARFDRLRDEQINAYIKNICEKCNDVYTKEGICQIDGLFIAGAGEIKDKFYKSSDFDSKIKKRVVKVHSIERNNIVEVVPIAETYFNSSQHIEDNKIMKIFIEHIENDTGKASYGKKCVEHHLKSGLLKDIMMLKGKFEKIDKIKIIAKKYGTCVHEIYNDKLDDYSGMAGILRYAM